MSSKPDRRADLAVLWMLAPIFVVVLGFVASKYGEGWDSVAYFFMFFALSIVLYLIPLTLGILSIKGNTEKKDKAILSIFVPLVVFILYLASIGGN
jgi:hypothetical protein